MEYPSFITVATWSDITETCRWLPQTPRPPLRVRQLDNFHGPALVSAIPIHLHAKDKLRLGEKNLVGKSSQIVRADTRCWAVARSGLPQS
jgi:hypothetical protein